MLAARLGGWRRIVTGMLYCTVTFHIVRREMSTFDSLTLAFEGWFDVPACDLPDALRQRVEQEFSPMPWDELSAEQRRSVAFDLDCQHDPATVQDRQFWWDFFDRMGTLKEQIAQWEAVATPTAGDLALRETRLRDLRQELARMELQKRQASGDCYPEHEPISDASEKSSSSQGGPVKYVAYPKAMAHLRKRLDATPEELTAWIWTGPKDGGIAAYVNANELDPPPRFRFALGSGKGDDHDYVSPLMACWFREDEIARFSPTHRYITGEALMTRWAGRPGMRADAWIRAKIRESRLSDLHPLYGGTQGTWPEDESLPPMTTGLFRLSDVEAIEEEDFADDTAPGNTDADSVRPKEGLAGSVGAGVAPSSVAGAPSPSLRDRRADVPSLPPNEGGVGVTAELEVGSREWRKRNAQAAANAMHDRPGGSRDKQRQIREAWASGKYSSRDTCAEQECAALGIPYSTARRALNNTPEPSRS